jgi:hypothetical protein
MLEGDQALPLAELPHEDFEQGLFLGRSIDAVHGLAVIALS